MNESTISNKINKLPPEAKKQAQDFVDYLYQQYVENQKLEDESEKISESSFFGIWKDREDMANSVKWVRETRKSQWPK